MSIKTVGFIGLGVMGASMAEHLLDGGYELVVFNRTKEKAEPLLAKGAKWAETPAEVAGAAEVVITIVGYPKDVEDVYLGKNGILETKKGGYVVDMTTSSPILARRIYKEAKAKGVAALDAPVSSAIFWYVSLFLRSTATARRWLILRISGMVHRSSKKRLASSSVSRETRAFISKSVCGFFTLGSNIGSSYPIPSYKIPGYIILSHFTQVDN